MHSREVLVVELGDRDSAEVAQVAVGDRVPASAGGAHRRHKLHVHEPGETEKGVCDGEGGERQKASEYE